MGDRRLSQLVRDRLYPGQVTSLPPGHTGTNDNELPINVTFLTLECTTIGGVGADLVLPQFMGEETQTDLAKYRCGNSSRC